MKFGILILITALTISGVAIYYSVAGLVAIFAAAPVAIIIMGGTLEVSKLVVAAWLHRYWDRAALWIKLYFSLAIFVLMILTSVGIFGFLSKSHTEQTALSTENVAQIARIENEIARQSTIVARAEDRIRKTESVGTGADVNVQAQIAREQIRVDQAIESLKEAEISLATQLTPYQDELTNIDAVLAQLQTAINQNNIKQAQSIAGTNPDGEYGRQTAAKIAAFRAVQLQRRQSLLDQISEKRTTGSTRTTLAAQQAEQGSALINRLRAQLGVTKTADIDLLIDEQQERVRAATTKIDTLTDEKFALEIEYRKLEAEVGPIKYVAEFVYGDANTNLLEEAVRWMIILIIIVFDPLAVALLLASQYTFRWHKQDNPGPNDDLWKDRDQFPGDDIDKEISELKSKHSISTLNEGLDEIYDSLEDADIKKINDEPSNTLDEDNHPASTNASRKGMYKYEPARSNVEMYKYGPSAPKKDLYTYGPPDNKVDTTEEVKKDVDISPAPYLDDLDSEVTEEDREWYKTLDKDELSRKELYEHLDSLGEWKEAKRSWKDRNPELTIKEYKRAYIRGSIDDLPWYD
jgi:peptidoglycan hydrolase-like protein with peptidoglycan-binding domain